MQIQIESAADVWDEIQPLLMEHWREIAHFDDIPLAPQRDVYDLLEATDKLRVFTVRLPSDRLIGYAVFLVDFDLHYGGSKQAKQDVLFLDPLYRGTAIGKALLEFADNALRDEGVQLVVHHVKLAHDIGPLLKHLRYTPVETIFVKRLDHGH